MSIQSIVVYRNPIEQAMWESGLVAPLIVAGAVLVITTIMTTKVMFRLRPKFRKWKYHRKLESNFPLVVGVSCFAATLWLML